MRHLITLLAIATFIGLPYRSFSGNEKSKRFLQFEGRIFQTGMDVRCSKKILDSAFIFIYDEKKMTTDTVMTSYQGNYGFRLPLNSQFMITVSKKGFVSKKLHANTHVPVFSKGENTMEFEMDLYKEVKDIDVSILDKPVADIYFNSKSKSFDYNRTYTDQVNRKLKTSYSVYYHKMEKPKALVVKTKW
ncbi:MAG TPA: hypothetical protein VFJ43_01465 [Bacteroidia bacterium]|nr:hypothetical protein [Bacteroidia bacterium]